MLRVDCLEQYDVAVCEPQLSNYRLSRRAEHHLRLGEEEVEYTLKLGSDVGSGNRMTRRKSACQKSLRR
jgi:type I restriction enzyme R subunit